MGIWVVVSDDLFECFEYRVRDVIAGERKHGGVNCFWRVACYVCDGLQRQSGGKLLMRRDAISGGVWGRRHETENHQSIPVYHHKIQVGSPDGFWWWWNRSKLRIGISTLVWMLSIIIKPWGRNPPSINLASMSNLGSNRQKAMTRWTKGAVGPPCFHKPQLPMALASWMIWGISLLHTFICLPNFTPSFAKFPI